MLNWIIKLIPDSTIRKVLAGWIRHLVNSLGVIIAAVSIPEVAQIGQLILANTDTITARVVALIMIGYAFISSYIAKKVADGQKK